MTLPEVPAAALAPEDDGQWTIPAMWRPTHRHIITIIELPSQEQPNG